MIRLKHLVAEQSDVTQQAIQLIGDDVDLFVHNYIDWLDENLDDLVDSGDMIPQQKFDTILNVRYELMDSEADDVVASIMRRHSDSFHPKTEVLQFIRKFI